MPAEPSYDDIAQVVAHPCSTPVALISFIDGTRVGVEMTETPRDVAFCAHAILNDDDLMEVHDASALRSLSCVVMRELELRRRSK